MISAAAPMLADPAVPILLGDTIRAALAIWDQNNSLPRAIGTGKQKFP